MSVERDLIDGLGRSLRRGRSPGPIARLGTRGMLDRHCASHPDTVRETLVELALMRAGWQRTSYRRELRKLIDVMEMGS